MKIGIVTFWTSNNNYGQILQNYALQTFLMQKGFNVELIRFNHKKTSIIKRIYNKIFKLINYRNLKITDNIDRKFQEFRKNNIKSSKLVYNGYNTILHNPPIYDIYIAGSDQIWSMPINKKENYYYFLSFVPRDKIKISYAASFGMDNYPIQRREKLKSLLIDFKYISCREKTGVDILKNIKIKASCVLDPTLLISPSDYTRLFKINNIDIESFIFIYHINIKKAEDLYWDTVNNYFSNEKKIVVTSSGRMPSIEILPNIKYSYPTVEDWLKYIYLAKFIITTSFHGMIFSIIFNKPFIVIPLKGKNSNSNNRIYDILNLLDLTNRIAKEEKDISKIIQSNINWNHVNSKLSLLKEDSYNFLYSAIHNLQTRK